MKNENIFVAVLDTNSMQTIEAIIALDKKDAKKTINEQMSLSQILLLCSLDEMKEMEEKHQKENSDFFVLSKNEFDVYSVDGKTKDEVESLKDDGNHLVFSKEVFLDVLSNIAKVFLDKLNTSPIVSEKMLGDIL